MIPLGRLDRDDFRLTRRVGLASSDENLAERDRELVCGIFLISCGGTSVLGSLIINEVSKACAANAIANQWDVMAAFREYDAVFPHYRTRTRTRACARIECDPAEYEYELWELLNWVALGTPAKYQCGSFAGYGFGCVFCP